MSTVDHERLSWIVDELDRIGPKDTPARAVRIHRGSARYKMIADQKGFLHLGRELLRVAATPATTPDRDVPLVQAEIRDVFCPESSVAIDHLERHDALPAVAPSPRVQFARTFAGSFAASLLAALFFIVGGITISLWATDRYVIPRYATETGPLPGLTVDASGEAAEASIAE